MLCKDHWTALAPCIYSCCISAGHCKCDEWVVIVEILYIFECGFDQVLSI